MSRSREIVKNIMDNFYNEHHDKEKFQNDLAHVFDVRRIEGFTEARHRLIEAIDFRMSETPGPLSTDARDELANLRSFIKGMLLKIDE